jgi:hypothetical protein
MARSNRPIKILVALGLLAILGFLFVRSARDSRANPYAVERAQLQGWTLAIEPASSPSAPLLVLRAPPELSDGLFRQVFARAMESLSMPVPGAIPLLLKGEFDRAFVSHLTPDALLAAARNAGLESAPPQPRCMGYRRVSSPERTRQLYFVLFDAPGFERFRAQLGAPSNDGAPNRGDYDPAALSPVLLIAASDTEFNGWLPMKADPAIDCVALIAINELRKPRRREFGRLDAGERSRRSIDADAPGAGAGR